MLLLHSRPIHGHMPDRMVRKVLYPVRHLDHKACAYPIALTAVWITKTKG